MLGIVCISGMSWLFYSLLGYTVPRLATGIALPIVVRVGLLAQTAAADLREPARRLNAAVLVGVMAALVFTLLKAGPYS